MICLNSQTTCLSLPKPLNLTRILARTTFSIPRSQNSTFTSKMQTHLIPIIFFCNPPPFIFVCQNKVDDECEQVYDEEHLRPRSGFYQPNPTAGLPSTIQWAEYSVHLTLENEQCGAVLNSVLHRLFSAIWVQLMYLCKIIQSLGKPSSKYTLIFSRNYRTGGKEQGEYCSV